MRSSVSREDTTTLPAATRGAIPGAAGVIEGPLQHEEGIWVGNLVITGKKWDTEEKKRGGRV